jgi:hypothetical protein
MKLALIGGIVAVLVLLCLGVSVAGGVAYMMMNSSDEASSSSTSSSTTPAEVDEPDEPAVKQDTAVQEISDKPPKVETKAEPPKADPKPATTPTTRRSTTPTTRTSSGNRTATAATGPTRVVFTVPGAGFVRCGDGTNKDADGRASITFKTVPADGITCTFYEGGSAPVCAGFVMPGNRKCTCDAASADLTCTD